MKLGAEPKKAAILAGLALVGAYTFYSNVLSGPDTGPGPQPAARQEAPAGPIAAPVATPAVARRAAGRNRSRADFRPSLKPRPEDRIDPISIDPMLRLDLLAKVQAVPLEGGARNVFQFTAAPPPPAPKGPEPKIVPKIPNQLAHGAGAVAPGGPAAPPPPPPITLKYYGYSMVKGTMHKTAFFLDGDDILVAGEGEVMKKRYKVVNIGVHSAVVEDTQFKHQQPLPLADEAPPMG